MNDFYVKTPEEWKEKLYMRIEKPKKTAFRPAVVLACAIASLILLSGSAFASRIINAPEYFGSKYLGATEQGNAVYSEKNMVFSSDRDDMSLTLKGIVGDNYSVYMLLELKSLGEVRFSEEKSYLFHTNDRQIPFSTGSGLSMNSEVIDEKTILFELSVSESSLVGKKITMTFRDIIAAEKGGFYKLQEECAFSGEFTVDYKNTDTILKKSGNTVILKGKEYSFSGAVLSNLHLKFSVSGNGKLNISEDDAVFLPEGNITLIYSDGSEENLRIKMPPAEENDVSVSSIGVKSDKINYVLHFPYPVNARNVVSIEHNGTVILVK